MKREVSTRNWFKYIILTCFTSKTLCVNGLLNKTPNVLNNRISIPKTKIQNSSLSFNFSIQTKTLKKKVDIHKAKACIIILLFFIIFYYFLLIFVSEAVSENKKSPTSHERHHKNTSWNPESTREGSFNKAIAGILCPYW